VDADIQMAFAFFKNQMDIDKSRYQNVIERNKQNGAKGGRPTREENPKEKIHKNPVGKNNPKNPVGFSKPKKPVNDNDNDNDNVNDNDNERNARVAISFESDWNLLLEKWKTLEGSPVKVVIPEWLIIPTSVREDFFMRCSEHGIERVLETVDLLRKSTYWQNRRIGIDKFLREDTFLKLHGSGYDWNPDKPKGSPNDRTNHPPHQPIRDEDERIKQRMRADYERELANQNRNADG